MKGFFFETKHGNRYFYNDITGEVTYVGDENSKTHYTVDNMKRIPLPEVHERDIRRFLEINGAHELYLIVTEDCNLRCKYCVYSGNYENMRTHRPVYMDFEVAKKAVDKFFRFYEEVSRRNPRLRPAVGFYGGEPLLNFKLIREVIEYIRRNGWNCLFTITTNGVLVDGEIADFLARNEVALAISLNGPRDEHDRLRVSPDSSGTYEIIVNNMRKLKEKYPEYFAQYCDVIVCYDYGSDLLEMARFFDENSDLFNVMRVNLIFEGFTNWYKQYSEEQVKLFAERMKKCREMYYRYLKEGKKSNFLHQLIGLQNYLILSRSMNLPLSYTRPPFLPFTATCVPGTKIAVEPQGTLHCCEKMPYNFPIGDVDRWLDFEKIKNLIEAYNNFMLPECCDCPISRLCAICYAMVAGPDGFKKDPEDICEKLKTSYRILFSEIWSLLEEGLDLFKLVGHESYKQCGVFV